MSDHWFKPKVYGYGAQPANWKGWVATFGFIALLLLESWLLIGFGPTSPTLGDIAVWVVAAFATTIAFVWLVKSKTKGDWGWRWGRDDG